MQAFWWPIHEYRQFAFLRIACQGSHQIGIVLTTYTPFN